MYTCDNINPFHNQNLYALVAKNEVIQLVAGGQGLPRDRVARGNPAAGNRPTFPPRTTFLLLRNPGGLRFSVFDFQSFEVSDIAQHSSRSPLRPIPPDRSPPLAMDFSKIQEQVSNLTLYDIKAGVRKVQNGML